MPPTDEWPAPMIKSCLKSVNIIDSLLHEAAPASPIHNVNLKIGIYYE